DERCIPTPPQRGRRVGGLGASGVAPPSNTPGIATPPRTPRAAGTPVLSRSRLARGAPRSSRCDARLSPRAVRRLHAVGSCPGRRNLAVLDPRPQGGGLSLCRAGTRGWLLHGRTSSRARVGT